MWFQGQVQGYNMSASNHRNLQQQLNANINSRRLALKSAYFVYITHGKRLTWQVEGSIMNTPPASQSVSMAYSRIENRSLFCISFLEYVRLLVDTSYHRQRRLNICRTLNCCVGQGVSRRNWYIYIPCLLGTTSIYYGTQGLIVCLGQSILNCFYILLTRCGG